MSSNLTAKWPRARALELRGIIHRMDLCACGTNAHWEIVRDLLTEAASEEKPVDGFYRTKWHEFGAKVLDSWKLLEHGSSIGYVWPTNDGRLLLDFLNDFGLEDHNFTTGEGQPSWSAEYSWGAFANADDEYSEWVRASLTDAGKVG